ncbi:tyrosine-type recombinase/integrase [Leadbettera azotonutricia]|uniref:Site-specific recombinase, phage integrase family n=1 Tax=Leadbettera azotonutricia (strain ATCC BAA-888 / DSM 13862 / ZAS-9) TaxID=545695 RepID=F5YDH2_LEAAZ|nr:tyrosine-type recombinase/integrase [Leadbettera azotonutricia]AEF82212.1 site-specific recombinase, phage integrase family [Leadbettera azotonutricia ZAS-9]
MRRYYLRRRKPGGNWSAIFMDTDTSQQEKTRTTRTPDEKKADAIAQEWLANGLPDDEPPISKTARSMSFCDFLTGFWDFDTSEYFKELQTMGKEPHRAHAQEQQKLVVRYYSDYFGNILLYKIEELKFVSFLVYLKQEKKLSASTINQARNVAVKALRYAKAKKMIKHFDFDAVFRAWGEPERRGILERNEVENLFKLEWRDPRSRLVNLIASQTGMRMGEIRALRVCDILKDRINVEHSWSKVDGGLKCTKTQEQRKIPILPELHEEFIVYIKQFGGLYRSESFLFPGINKDIPYDNKQIEKDYHAMLEKIQIDDKKRKERNIVFHSWRHYCAKNLAQANTPRAIAMAILGHKTGFLFDYYARHFDTETFDKMAEAIKQGLRPRIEELHKAQ